MEEQILINMSLWGICRSLSEKHGENKVVKLLDEAMDSYDKAQAEIAEEDKPVVEEKPKKDHCDY